MGSTHEFACFRCSYAADLSGGKDAASGIVTVSLLCLDCQELREFTARELGAGAGGADLVHPLGCPVDPTHRVRRWRAGGFCPKCGALMVRGSPVARAGSKGEARRPPDRA
jgi:hypothetical protein